MDFPTEDDLTQYCQSTGRAYVTIELQQAGEAPLGSILLELFTDICPKTCEHFIGLVKGIASGHGYRGTPIHRIVKGAYIQGGDVVDGTGKGNPGFSIPDETFAVKHSEAGILGMANNGEPHTAASQFYITQGPLPWLDGSRVAFGRVLTAAGLQLLKTLDNVMVSNERPVPDITISECKVLVQP